MSDGQVHHESMERRRIDTGIYRTGISPFKYLLQLCFWSSVMIYVLCAVGVILALALNYFTYIVMCKYID